MTLIFTLIIILKFYDEALNILSLKLIPTFHTWTQKKIQIISIKT